MFSQSICIEDEKIKAVKYWFEPKLVRDIQVFLRFANFYWQFIQGFSCITIPLNSMLKTIGSIRFIANHKETKGKAGGNGMVGNRMVDGNEVTN